MQLGGAIDSERSYSWAVDDEEHITKVMPQKQQRHSVAVGRALAVHFSFFKQQPGLEGNTTLLADYTSLARQFCGSLLEPSDTPQ
jgi:hypothetical protein